VNVPVVGSAFGLTVRFSDATLVVPAGEILGAALGAGFGIPIREAVVALVVIVRQPCGNPVTWYVPENCSLGAMVGPGVAPGGSEGGALGDADPVGAAVADEATIVPCNALPVCIANVPPAIGSVPVRMTSSNAVPTPS